MREILFRGKRVDNEEWVYGDLTHSVYKISDTCVGKYGSEIGMHQVYQYTVGQFTGQTDKNGEKIFEGDIVKAVNMGKLMVISYQSGSFGLCREDTYYADLGEYEKRQIQVIGNIYDNPEISPNRW